MMNKRRNTFYAVFIVAFIFFILLFTRLYLDVRYCVDPQSIDLSLIKWYYVGGILSGVFAGAAFGGVLYTIYQQREQTKKQEQFYNEQLRKAGESLNHQISVNNRQVKEEKIRRFENTFFQMLSLHQEIVSELEYQYTKIENLIEEAPHETMGAVRVLKQIPVNIIYQSRNLFRFLFDEIASGNKTKGMRGFIHEEGILNYGESLLPTYFDHYFRHLYTIIKFIDKTDFMNFDEKYKYTSIVRATLSRYELIWLYYNCLSEVGRDKFKPLVEEYSLLKNLRENFLAISKEFEDFYSQGGYKFTRRDLISSGFSGTDYEFLLTTNRGTKDKYYIGAFYPQKEINRGISKMQSWNKYLENNI